MLNPHRLLKLDSNGHIPKGLTFILFAMFVFAVIGTFKSTTIHAYSASPYAIRSGVSGDCLDDINNQLISGAPVDNQACNGGDNQNWSVNTIEIKHGSLCLNVIGASQKVGAKVDLNKCNDSPGQVWLNDQNSLFNPNAGLCLSDPASVSGQQLSLGKCDGQDNTKWSSPMLNLNCNNISAEGAKIACYAESDWEEWQAEPNAHPSLLNAYTDGAPYEEWCADFVSYVYNQAGYPFKSAYDGWDENNANNVSNYGFTVHDTSYVPSPGDIGYFDYSGGHVEIVISGGPQPTFIYGNSATIDPTTGNGQMESNTILQDGSNGNITNYYSPTSGS